MRFNSEPHHFAGTPSLLVNFPSREWRSCLLHLFLERVGGSRVYKYSCKQYSAIEILSENCSSICFLKPSSPEGSRRIGNTCSNPVRLTPFDFGNELIAMPSLKKKRSNYWALGSHVLSFLRNSTWVHTLQRYSILEGKYFLSSHPLTLRSKGRVWTSLILCQFNNSLVKLKKKIFAYLLVWRIKCISPKKTCFPAMRDLANS